jgi:hypothetical protein
MTCAFITNVIAASLGLMSGLWLCYPTAASNPHSLAWVASPPWKSAEGKTDLAIAQSAQYSIGGLLLVAAFVLQVLATLAPTAKLQVPHPMFEHEWLVAVIVFVATVAALIPVTFFAYKGRKKQLLRKVHVAQQYLKDNPRLTPLP